MITIDGEVVTPRILSLGDLRALNAGLGERSTRLHGRLVSAVDLPALTAAVGLKPSARVLVAVGGDGFVAHVPVDALERCWLAYALEGAPLAERLGGPCRLVVAGDDPCGDVKGLCALHLVAAAVVPEHVCAHRRRPRAAAARRL